jgi:tetratricopeptide (TPR) repeat protein
MKTMIYVVIVCFSIIFTISAQKVSVEDEVADKITKLIDERGYEKRIEISGKRLAIAESNNDWETAVSAIYETIWLEGEYLEFLEALNIRFSRSTKLQKHLSKIRSLRESIDDSWLTIVEIHDKRLLKETNVLAEALATVGREKMSPLVMFNTHRVSRKDFTLGEEYYLRSISIKEKIFGTHDHRTLRAIADFGNRMFEAGKFEKSIPIFEKLTSLIEKQVEIPSDIVSNAFHNYAAIYSLIGNESKATELLDKLSPFTKKTEVLSAQGSDLSRRTKEILIDKNALRPIRTGGVGGIGGRPVRAGASDSYSKTPGLESLFPQLVSPTDSFPNGLKGQSLILTDWDKLLTARVEIGINEEGNVFFANAIDIQDNETKIKLEKSVKKLKFEPFVSGGVAKIMKGYVSFRYFPPFRKK